MSPMAIGPEDVPDPEWVEPVTYTHPDVYTVGVDLAAVLGDVYGGVVFAAHVDMLREHLGEP